MRLPSTAFIDRDGVLNRKPPEGSYVLDPESLELIPGAVDALAELSSAGVRTVIVTNQQGVGKGLLTIGELNTIHDRLRDQVEARGGRIDQLLVCPHLDGTCACRKPLTGLFFEARRRDASIDFADSVVIGDSRCDMEAAEAIGSRGILVGDGPGCEAPSLADAVVLLRAGINGATR